ncbi:MAG: NAD(P)/FAD-dependent oxidoreductase [Bacillota bacterium]|nr:NAD(P)/FAD-dependent oxidoreductase [Bacillota bacterium]
MKSKMKFILGLLMALFGFIYIILALKNPGFFLPLKKGTTYVIYGGYIYTTIRLLIQNRIKGVKGKKIIIVGGGISGLISGIYARKAGFDVEIFEKNPVAGGECTGWDRGPYHIDNCIHWLMGTKQGSDLNKIWNTVGALDNVKVLSFDRMYTSKLNGKSITLYQDADRTERELIELSPEDEEEIKKLINNVKKAENVMIPANKPTDFWGLFDLIKMGKDMKVTFSLFKEYSGQDTKDLMNRFKHPLIKCMISDFCTRESLGRSFPIAYGNFVSGDGGIPQGGSRKMAERMEERLKALGGTIFKDSQVEKIEIKDKKGTGIIMSDGSFHSADYIICACDTDWTFNHLLGKEYMSNLFREVYNNREAYPVYGMFQAAFAVDGDLTLDSETILDFDKPEEWMSDRLTVKTYQYEPSFAPSGKQILQVLLGMEEKAYEYWEELYKNKEAYKAKKIEFAKVICQRITDEYPQFEGKLELLDTWTPMTYKRYCNAYKGYNQAFVITKKSRKNPYPSPYIKNLSNVILSGQWVSPPGGLPGAAITGKFAVQRILKKEKQDVDI